MVFELPALPYGYDALEPHVDTMTMNIHHTKHHQTYINNANKVIAGAAELQNKSLEDLNKTVASLDASVQTAIRNNAGGHYNHSFFWTIMGKPSDHNSAPFGELKEDIEKTFGSVDAMKEEFNKAAAGRFGSGWAWLVLDREKNLKITSTPNQDNPLMEGIADVTGSPVLGLDVWEHAYYLKYQNRRPEYIAAWWSVVNWDQVVEQYAVAKKA